MASSTINVQPKLSYDVHLWDGFDHVRDHSKHTLRHLKEMKKFFVRRAQIEEEYAKHLMSACKQFEVPNAHGTLGSTWRTILQQTEAMASSHMGYAGQLKNEVVEPLGDFYSSAKQQREAIVVDGLRQTKMLQESREHAHKAHHSYDKAYRDVTDAKAAGKSLTKKQASLEEKTMDYRSSIQNTNHFQKKFIEEQMPECLRLLQDLDMRRIRIAHQALAASLDSHKQVPNAEFASDKVIAQSIDEISVARDIDEFVQRHVTTAAKPDPLEFEEANANSPTKIHDGRKRAFLSSIRARFRKGASHDETPSPPSSAGSSSTALRDRAQTAAAALPSAPIANHVFGVTLEELMAAQASEHPTRDVPLVLTTLIDKLDENGATSTEGIFRIPADAGQVRALREQLGTGNYIIDSNDPHICAAVLKLWLRELKEPLIPASLYDQAVAAAADGKQASAVQVQLDPLRQRVLSVLLSFLGRLAATENQAKTRMDDSNLAMVFAPGFLRCPSDNPMVIMVNTNNEKMFVLSLMRNFAQGGGES